jgi:hypothetical protein
VSGVGRALRIRVLDKDLALSVKLIPATQLRVERRVCIPSRPSNRMTGDCCSEEEFAIIFENPESKADNGRASFPNCVSWIRRPAQFLTHSEAG